MAVLDTLDHCILLVADLDAAEVRMRRLGFVPTPRARHSAGLGTANATIVLPDRKTYFEVLGIVEATPANAGKRAFLARSGEGLYGLAFKTGDARATAARLAALGLGDGAAVDFARPVALPGGPAEAAFAVAGTHDDALPGAWVFACQHKTPAVVWREDHLRQPNGASALVEVVGVADHLDVITAAWERPFAGLVRHREDAVAVTTGTAVISFLTPAGVRARWAIEVRPAAAVPGLAGLVFASADLAATRCFLETAGIAAKTAAAGELVVDAATAGGAFLAFRAAG